MRIGAGERKGLLIPLPKGLTIRPTLARVKEALFDILSPRIHECTFLDLYAGTGSIGLEAHSRGAATVIFVEQNRKTSALLRRNIERYCTAMSREQRSALHIHTLNVATYLLGGTRNHATPIDIIFADPPYDTPFLPALHARLSKGNWLQSDGVLVVEHRFKHATDDTCGRFSKTATYRYGDSALSLYNLTPIPLTDSRP